MYKSAIAIGDGDILIRVFASEDDLEAKADFRFPAKGKKGVQIDDVKPGSIISRSGRKLDSRAKTYEGLKQATEKSATLTGVTLTVGQGNQVVVISVGEMEVDGEFLKKLLDTVVEKFQPDTPMTITFRKISFQSGHDLKDFADKLNIQLTQSEVEQ